MEKVTKKKKSKKGLRKRIGIIAVGGLSLVLTVCLSVGATLAWFAGSTWASKSLYMGGPVYVEMAGRGTSGSTAGSTTGEAKWVGGDGKLDIEAAATRTTGTADLKIDENNDDKPDINLNDVLLPGQKVQVYSQARVFSTAETTTVDDNAIKNESSGANTTNTSNGSGTATYQNTEGRVTTTTTSVLRARFSLEVEFDAGMGFNNYTDPAYMGGYPVQSSDYTGQGTTGAWTGALTDTAFETKNDATAGTTGGTITYTGRRDAVKETGSKWIDEQDAAACKAIRQGTSQSIYKWKYVSAAEYAKASDSLTPNEFGSKMAAPFAGTPIDAADAPTGYYGVWVSEPAAGGGYKLSESDAFYKARCNAYLNTYVEFYVNEYGNTVRRTVKDSVTALEANLNSQFVKLVNDSSDAIRGTSAINNKFKVGSTETTAQATWLYIDPSIGNDTNTDEISTSVGGWWYLVASDNEAVGSTGEGDNTIYTAVDTISAGVAREDRVAGTTGLTDGNYSTANTITNAVGFTRKGTAETSTDRLNARLFEIIPTQDLSTEVVTKNNGEDVIKVVSPALPFVNGTFALPADALTNLFANAKITFKIAFQALQAFFPYTESIDKVDYKDAILGTEKALNIKNAIPIFNEAFDYQETAGGAIEGL